MVSKVFTCILNRRITVWIDEGEKIAEEQAGFMSGYSTPIISFISFIQKSMGQGKGKVYVAFTDYQKAFDRVNSECLLACLRDKGLSREMININRSMYESVLRCVRAGYDYTHV